VVSCGDFKYLHRAQFDIDLDFSEMRAESEDRVGDALTVLIERAGRRVECSLGGKSVSVSIEGQIGKLDAPMMLSILNSNSAILRILRRSSWPAIYAAFPVTNVCRDAEVLPQSGVIEVSPEIRPKRSIGHPSASAQICVTTVADPCPMSIAP